MTPNEFKLLQLLSNNDVTFFIPPYQRNYEWTKEQCEVFLDDILKTTEANMRGKKTEHFFGTVTCFKTDTPFGQPSKLVLIDGQQRITTTMLFLVALRDTLGKNELGKYIDAKYLKNDNVSGDSEYKIKLKQVESDWSAYRNIILSYQLSDKEKNSAVYRNYQYFFNKLQGLKDDRNNLSELIEKGLDKFSVVAIELEPEKNEWENPQEIFESMNSLGKPLSLADLVRNYLLLGQSADEQERLYNQYWLQIEKAIPGQVSDFIRDFMQAQEMRSFHKATETNYKDLYGQFKKMFSAKDAESLLKSLAESAHVYAYLVTDISCGNAEIDGQLQDLKTLNVTTAYSFLLELLKSWKQGNFTDKDIYGILDVFKIYCLRRRIIGLTAAENRNFPILVSRIPDLRIANDKKEKMYEILARQENNLRLPNDIELDRYLRTMNFANFRYCKFYLSLVEEKITKNRPSQTDSRLQIEHILPQTLSEEWRNELGGDNPDELHQSLVNTIGNITLIRHNQELGNKSFKDKKEVYENKAGLQIAKTKIVECSVWNADSINVRTDWIISYLLSDVLPIPNSMRKTNNFTPKEGRYLSFQNLQLIGLNISFIEDPTIVARVVSDKEVEFEGKRWKLSPLTRELQTRRGKVNASGSYQGPWWWQYDGKRLSDIIDQGFTAQIK